MTDYIVTITETLTTTIILNECEDERDAMDQADWVQRFGSSKEERVTFKRAEDASRTINIKRVP